MEEVIQVYGTLEIHQSLTIQSANANATLIFHSVVMLIIYLQHNALILCQQILDLRLNPVPINYNYYTVRLDLKQLHICQRHTRIMYNSTYFEQ